MTDDREREEWRFSRGEYWLLESAVQWLAPLNWLLSPNLPEAMNKPGHGLTPEGLVSTLEGLLSEDLLYVESDDVILTPTRAELIGLLNEKPSEKRAHYGLTTKGGRAWEEFAAPEWECFVDETYCLEGSDDADDPPRGCLTCVRKRLVERYFYLMQEFGGLTVLPESVTHKTLQPWQATYWKTLPSAHRISFRYTGRDGPQQSFRDYYQVMNMGEGWYRWR